jgi:hypothetical protein
MAGTLEKAGLQACSKPSHELTPVAMLSTGRQIGHCPGKQVDTLHVRGPQRGVRDAKSQGALRLKPGCGGACVCACTLCSRWPFPHGKGLHCMPSPAADIAAGEAFRGAPECGLCVITAARLIRACATTLYRKLRALLQSHPFLRPCDRGDGSAYGMLGIAIGIKQPMQF